MTTAGEVTGVHIGERVIGADLPKHQVGLVERDLVLHADGGAGGELAGDAAVDHDDVDALERVFQHRLDQLGIAAAARGDVAGRRAHREDAQVFALRQRGRDVGQW